MLKKFIITSLRYLGKNFLFVGINILGLAIALALCITAYLNNKYDMDWDKTHANYENIYKINITREIQDRQQEYGITPIALAPLLEQDLAGVEEVTRYRNSYSPVKFGDKIFSKRIAYVDPNFLKVFTLNIIKGNKNALAEKGNILINERIANVYFGEEDPLGKVISIVNDKNHETTFIVAGIYKNLPQNSSFRCELLTQLENFEDMWEIEAEKWDSWVGATYLLVRNENNIPKINEQLKKYIAIQNDIREDWIITSFLQKH